MKRLISFKLILIGLIFSFLISCGGGGGGGSSSSSSGSGSVTLSGVAYDEYVVGATASLYIDGSFFSDTNTDDNGSFSFEIPSDKANGIFTIEIEGGEVGDDNFTGKLELVGSFDDEDIDNLTVNGFTTFLKKYYDSYKDVKSYQEIKLECENVLKDMLGDKNFFEHRGGDELLDLVNKTLSNQNNINSPSFIIRSAMNTAISSLDNSTDLILVTGFVKNKTNDNPLSSAVVSISGDFLNVGLSTITDENGKFAFVLKNPEGRQLIFSIRKDGFVDTQKIISNVSGDIQNLEFALKPVESKVAIDLNNFDRVVLDANSEELGDEIVIRSPKNDFIVSFSKSKVLSSIKEKYKKLLSDNTTLYIQVTKGDPVTEKEIFPGDFQAIDSASSRNTSADDNNTVGLESVAFINVSIVDNEGNTYQPNAEVSMDIKLPESLQEKYLALYDEGVREIPWYYYDEADKIWKRAYDSDGNPKVAFLYIKETDNGREVWAKGKADHFSWWNVDWPIITQTKLTVRVAKTDDSSVSNAYVMLEGISYEGAVSGTTDDNGTVKFTVRKDAKFKVFVNGNEEDEICVTGSSDESLCVVDIADPVVVTGRITYCNGDNLIAGSITTDEGSFAVISGDGSFHFETNKGIGDSIELTISYYDQNIHKMVNTNAVMNIGEDFNYCIPVEQQFVDFTGKVLLNGNPASGAEIKIGETTAYADYNGIFTITADKSTVCDNISVSYYSWFANEFYVKDTCSFDNNTNQFTITLREDKIEIDGYVYDENGNPIPYVYISGSDYGSAVTDRYGHFIMTLPSRFDNSVVKFHVYYWDGDFENTVYVADGGAVILNQPIDYVIEQLSLIDQNDNPLSNYHVMTYYDKYAMTNEDGVLTVKIRKKEWPDNNALRVFVNVNGKYIEGECPIISPSSFDGSIIDYNRECYINIPQPVTIDNISFYDNGTLTFDVANANDNYTVELINYYDYGSVLNGSFNDNGTHTFNADFSSIPDDAGYVSFQLNIYKSDGSLVFQKMLYKVFEVQNNPPVIDGFDISGADCDFDNNNCTLVNGEDYKVYIYAYDPDYDDITTWCEYDNGTKIDNCSFVAQANISSIKIFAKDSANSQVSKTINLDYVNPTPKVNSLLIKENNSIVSTIKPGDNISFELVGEYLDNKTFTWIINGDNRTDDSVFDNYIVDNVSGLNITVKYDGISLYDVVIPVRLDSANNLPVIEYNINLQTVDNGSGVIIPAGIPVVLNYKVSDPDFDEVSCSVNNGGNVTVSLDEWNTYTFVLNSNESIVLNINCTDGYGTSEFTKTFYAEQVNAGIYGDGIDNLTFNIDNKTYSFSAFVKLYDIEYTGLVSDNISWIVDNNMTGITGKDFSLEVGAREEKDIYIKVELDNLTITSEHIVINKDTDNDSLPDGEEINITHTDYNNSDSDNDSLSDGLEVITYHTDPLNPDSDNDNLTDKAEIDNGTNPLKSDTDNDNLSDGLEVLTYHTNPLNSDSDNDNLSDGLEVLTHHTDPLNSDSDNDNLSDGLEILTHHTDPLNPDSDNDNLTDGEEVLTYHTNPLSSDSDNDNLTDYEEIVNHGTSPISADTDEDGLNDYAELFTYNTNPLNFDSDNDNLSDGEEVFTHHTDPLNPDSDNDNLTDGEEVLTHNTDPLKWDTDGDGLSDYEELYTYHTEPTKVDSDGDGIADNVEIANGSDPNSPDVVNLSAIIANFENGNYDMAYVLAEQIKDNGWAGDNETENITIDEYKIAYLLASYYNLKNLIFENSVFLNLLDLFGFTELIDEMGWTSDNGSYNDEFDQLSANFEDVLNNAIAVADTISDNAEFSCYGYKVDSYSVKIMRAFLYLSRGLLYYNMAYDYDLDTAKNEAIRDALFSYYIFKNMHLRADAQTYFDQSKSDLTTSLNIFIDIIDELAADPNPYPEVENCDTELNFLVNFSPITIEFLPSLKNTLEDIRDSINSTNGKIPVTICSDDYDEASFMNLVDGNNGYVYADLNVNLNCQKLNMDLSKLFDVNTAFDGSDFQFEIISVDNLTESNQYDYDLYVWYYPDPFDNDTVINDDFVMTDNSSAYEKFSQIVDVDLDVSYSSYCEDPFDDNMTYLCPSTTTIYDYFDNSTQNTTYENVKFALIWDLGNTEPVEPTFILDNGGKGYVWIGDNGSLNVKIVGGMYDYFDGDVYSKGIHFGMDYIAKTDNYNIVSKGRLELNVYDVISDNQTFHNINVWMSGIDLSNFVDYDLNSGEGYVIVSIPVEYIIPLIDNGPGIMITHIDNLELDCNHLPGVGFIKSDLFQNYITKVTFNNIIDDMTPVYDYREYPPYFRDGTTMERGSFWLSYPLLDNKEYSLGKMKVSLLCDQYWNCNNGWKDFYYSGGSIRLDVGGGLKYTYPIYSADEPISKPGLLAKRLIVFENGKYFSKTATLPVKDEDFYNSVVGNIEFEYEVNDDNNIMTMPIGFYYYGGQPYLDNLTEVNEIPSIGIDVNSLPSQVDEVKVYVYKIMDMYYNGTYYDVPMFSYLDINFVGSFVIFKDGNLESDRSLSKVIYKNGFYLIALEARKHASDGVIYRYRFGFKPLFVNVPTVEMVGKPFFRYIPESNISDFMLGLNIDTGWEKILQNVKSCGYDITIEKVDNSEIFDNKSIIVLNDFDKEDPRDGKTIYRIRTDSQPSIGEYAVSYTISCDNSSSYEIASQYYLDNLTKESSIDFDQIFNSVIINDINTRYPFLEFNNIQNDNVSYGIYAGGDYYDDGQLFHFETLLFKYDVDSLLVKLPVPITLFDDGSNGEKGEIVFMVKEKFDPDNFGGLIRAKWLYPEQ